MTSKIAQLANVEAFTEQVQAMQDAPIGQDRMACLYGPSGWGKTTAVSSAQVIFDVIAVEVIENTSKMGLLDQILEQIQIKCRRDVHSRIMAIGDFLTQSQRALVIDDAQYLIKRGMIGIARDIYNRTGGMVPVILVGEEKLPQDLTRFENVHGRISNWTPMQPCSLQDGERLASIYADGVAVDPELLTQIVTSAGGSIRRVSTMLGAARELARGKGKKTVDLQDWGDKPFFDGQPPIERKVTELRSKPTLITPASKKAVQA